MNIVMIHNRTNPTGIQSGAVIHHHDQSMVPVSFNMRNTRNNIRLNVPPDTVILFLSDILYYFEMNTNVIYLIMVIF